MAGRIKGLLLHYGDYDYAVSSHRRFWGSISIVVLEGVLAAPLSLLFGLLLLKVMSVCGIL